MDTRQEGTNTVRPCSLGHYRPATRVTSSHFSKESVQVTVSKDSPAVVVARAHMEAWNNHDFDTARAGLADNVEVTAMSTKPGLPGTNLTGIDDYMRGLHTFADPIVPGSLRVLASIGDEHNALLMVTVEADFGGGGDRHARDHVVWAQHLFVNRECLSHLSFGVGILAAHERHVRQHAECLSDLRMLESQVPGLDVQCFP
jgi:hypothetical protein